MIKELTSLRFIFIALIFIHHIGVYPGGGPLGVAFFYVLSGFSLTLGYGEKIKKGNFLFSPYVLKRFWKFYPIHWLCLFLAIPYAIYTYGEFQVPEFFANAALIHSWIPVGTYYFSFNSVSWYLADTVFLALIFPFIGRLFLNLRKKNLIIISFVLLASYTIIEILLWHHDVFQFIYINPVSRIPDFIIGVQLAIFFKDFCIKEDSKYIFFVRKHYNMATAICVFFVVLLIFESVLIPDKLAQIAGVFWPFIAVVVLSAASLGKLWPGGGQFIKRTCSCLARKY